MLYAGNCIENCLLKCDNGNTCYYDNFIGKYNSTIC